MADKRLRAPEGLLDDVPIREGPGDDDGFPTPNPGPLEDEDPGWVPYDHAAPVRGLEAFQGLLERIQYKSGYGLRVEHPILDGSTHFLIRAKLRNTYRPSDPPGVINMRFPLPRHVLERWGEWLEWGKPEQAQDSMLRYVRKCLGWHELHERDEWLLVDGARPFDPHKDGRNQPFVPG